MRMQILIIDDDPIATAVLESTLRAAGHEVVMATDGRAGWRAFSAAPYRLVISDWLMPELDGLELCRRIRQAGGEYTYFILLSNLASTGTNLDQAIAAGVDDFLSKPLNGQELRARLHVAARILAYATELRQLQQIIPICGYCRKIRDDRNSWSQLEEYVSRHSGLSFSHGVCPDCYERVLVPQMKKAGVAVPPYPVARKVRD